MAPHRIFNFESFLGRQSEQIAEIAMTLDDLFLSYPNVGRKMRFNVPFYDYTTWICYVNPIRRKTDAIELVFLQGRNLMEHFPVLQDKGRKMVAGIEMNQINDEVLEEIIVIWEYCLSEKQRQS